MVVSMLRMGERGRDGREMGDGERQGGGETRCFSTEGQHFSIQLYN